jgi:hypothetical protein
MNPRCRNRRWNNSITIIIMFFNDHYTCKIQTPLTDQRAATVPIHRKRYVFITHGRDKIRFLFLFIIFFFFENPVFTNWMYNFVHFSIVWKILCSVQYIDFNILTDCRTCKLQIIVVRFLVIIVNSEIFPG